MASRTRSLWDAEGLRWVWVLVLFASSVLLMWHGGKPMTLTDWWSLIAGTIGFVWAGASAVFIFYRLQSPWQMFLTIVQKGEQQIQNYPRRNLAIQPDSYVVIASIVAERRIAVSEVSIGFKHRVSRKSEIRLVIDNLKRGRTEWSFPNILHAPRRLLILPRLAVCPTKIVEVQTIRDITPFHDNMPPPLPRHGNLWKFHYEPKLELDAGSELQYSIALRVPEGSNRWDGKLEICAVKPVRRRVRIGERTDI